jgi:hypothetical protein
MTVRNDPIVEGTRAARRELHEEFAGDTAALFRYLKQIESENADRVVTLAPKPAVQTSRKVS